MGLCYVGPVGMPPQGTGKGGLAWIEFRILICKEIGEKKED